MPESLGIYVSIPFCRAKCTFCNFASEAFPPGRMQGYVERLLEEIADAPRTAKGVQGLLPASVDSVYLGGGTPSLLSPQQFRSVITGLRDGFNIAPDAEITMEAAPSQIDDALLDEALRCGVNRISLGVQSFVDAEAKAVGRLHTGAACRAEVTRLQRAGVPRLSLDLIAGLPHQTQASLAESLQQAIGSGVEHVSVYMLETDGESRLGTEVERLRAVSQLTVLGEQARYSAEVVPQDEVCADLYAQACDALVHGGYGQYEISNFARPGAQSAHNRKYWDRAPYFGFGLDAHSMLRCDDGCAVRFRNGDELEGYLSAAAPAEVTPVDALAALDEAVFLGLRRVEGIAIATLEPFQQPQVVRGLLGRARDLVDADLLVWRGDRLCLTAAGRVVSSAVFGELLTATI